MPIGNDGWRWAGQVRGGGAVTSVSRVTRRRRATPQAAAVMQHHVVVGERHRFRLLLRRHWDIPSSLSIDPHLISFSFSFWFCFIFCLKLLVLLFVFLIACHLFTWFDLILNSLFIYWLICIEELTQSAVVRSVDLVFFHQLLVNRISSH